MKDKIKSTFSCNIKLTILFLVYFLIIIFAFYFLERASKMSDSKRFNYSENSKVTYKVRLKDNDFYDTKVLDQNMSYIANLIDKIKIKFHYNFDSDKKTNAKYNYKIVAKLEIINPKNKEPYIVKNYDLLDEKTDSFKNKNSYNLNESLLIDYDYYNSLANTFKKTYDIDASANLIITCSIDKKIDKISTNSEDMEIIIPLIDKAINIDIIGSKDVNNNKIVVVDHSLDKLETRYLSIGIVLLAVAILMISFISKNLKIFKINYSEYDFKLKKIKRMYNRLLVEINREPNYSKFEVVDVKDFTELVDLHYECNENVRFIEFKEKQKCVFYIQYKKTLYRCILEKSDV